MEWIEKSRSYTKARFDSEVVVSTTMIDWKKQVCFRFRKNSAHKLFSNEPFLVVARDGNKIYFKEASPITGYKLQETGPDSRYLRLFSDKLIKDEECGEFNLEFDRELGLCFINLDRKLTKELNWFGKE